MIVKTIIIVALALIVGSLAQGLYYMMTDHGNTTRTVKALSIRIGLSLVLFGLLFIAQAAGWLTPHGVYPQ